MKNLRGAVRLGEEAHDLLKRVHAAVFTLCDVRAQAEAWADRVESSAVKGGGTALARTR